MATTLDQAINQTIDTLISESELKERVSQLAAQLSSDYASQDLMLVCILRGGVVFLTDLMRELTIPHHIDFMAVSSYRPGVRESDGMVRITLDLLTDIQGRNVLLVEDIVDTGYTVSRVLDLLSTRSPASLRVCCLLDKAERRKMQKHTFPRLCVPAAWLQNLVSPALPIAPALPVF